MSFRYRQLQRAFGAVKGRHPIIELEPVPFVGILKSVNNVSENARKGMHDFTG